MSFETVLETLLGYCLSIGGKILIALIVLVIGFKLVNYFHKKIRAGKVMSKLDNTVANFISKALAIVAKTLLVATAISIMGVPTSSVITVLASAGAAIGLAMQGALSNFAGGVMIMIFKPFHAGDYIELQGVSGTVKEIGIVYTVLTTPDNKGITLPNGSAMNSVVTNHSANDTRRVSLSVKVALDSDIDFVRDLLRSIVAAHPLVEKDLGYGVNFTKRGEYALEFSVSCWAKRQDSGKVMLDLNEAVEKAFAKTGVVVPLQQMEVHVKNVK